MLICKSTAARRAAVLLSIILCFFSAVLFSYLTLSLSITPHPFLASGLL